MDGDEVAWALAIGRSIIAVGRLEYSTTVLLRQCLPDAHGRAAARLELSARLGYFDKLLRRCGLTTAEERRWRRVTQTIGGLRTRHRETLAYQCAPHPGPIEFTGDSIIVRGPHTRPRHPERLVTLPQIELAVERIAAAHTEFLQVANGILDRLFEEDRFPLPAYPSLPKRSKGGRAVKAG